MIVPENDLLFVTSVGKTPSRDNTEQSVFTEATIAVMSGSPGEVRVKGVVLHVAGLFPGHSK